MEIGRMMRQVLEQDAESLMQTRCCRTGKSAARAIGETLARAAMEGDMKAAAMVLELAGRAAEGSGMVVVMDSRPEESREA